MSFFRDLDWSNWLLGLWNAVVGGSSSGVIAGLVGSNVDPHGDAKFGSMPSLKLMASVALASGAFHFFAYLKQNPSPGLIKTTTTVFTKEERPTQTVITKVEETAIKTKDQVEGDH